VKNLFEEREIYESKTTEESLNVFDNWDSGQFLYGKVSKRDRTVAPLDRTSLKKIINSDVFVLNFVADAFEDMKEYYSKNLNSATNFQVPSFAGMSTLEARKGYIKPIGLYRQNMAEARNIFVGDYLFGQRIESFDQALEKFNIFTRDYASKVPMLYSVFMASSACPIQSSGLVIEVTRDPHNNSDPKDDFIDDALFDFYLDMLSKFGFVAAKNAPWCLVANLNSPAMYEYAKFYDVKRQADIIDEYYYECKDFDIDLMREFVYESFLQVQEEDYVETTHRICNNKTVTKNVLRESVDIRSEIDKFDNSQWMKIYLRVLVLQSGVTVPDERLEVILSEFMTVYQQTDFERAYGFIVSEIKKLPKSLDIQSGILYSNANANQVQQSLQSGATGGVSGY
jgi:hypothetical protein